MIRLRFLMAACCLLSVVVFAQKAPKGKLLSYSHTCSNPEIPLDYEFKLSWNDGKGTLSINNESMESAYEYDAEVGEDVFREVADIIKQKKLYVVGKKKTEDPKYIPFAYPGRESFSLEFEDGSFRINFSEVTLEQRDAFEALKELVKARSKESLLAETLSGYSHSMQMKVLPPDVPDNYLYWLDSKEGKTTLMMNYGSKDSLTVDVPHDVLGKVFQLFNEDLTPEQISGALKLQGISVSHETIYRRIYAEILAGRQARELFEKSFP